MRAERTLLTLAVLAATLGGPAAAAERPFHTENVFIVVIDGVRYSEGFGDPAHRYIPGLAGKLAPLGVVNTAFYNDGTTKTVPGHASLLTGTWERLGNSYAGNQHPDDPTLFEYWRKEKHAPLTDTLLVSSKRKLKGLAYSRAAGYGKAFAAEADAGSNDVPFFKMFSSGYREDDVTFEELGRAMGGAARPRVVMVNLREPDSRGHDGDWNGYLDAISRSDKLVLRMWDLIESNPFYAGKTSLFVTNDHGRHLDSHGGFSEHGCSCDGCRHISLLALGPDFVKGREVSTRRTLVDIVPTAALLLGIETPRAKGSVMVELFGDALPARAVPVIQAAPGPVPDLLPAPLAPPPVEAAPVGTH